MKKFFYFVALMSSLAVVIPNAQAARVTHLVFADGAIHAHCTWVKGPLESPEESFLRVDWKSGVDHTAIEPPGAFKVALFMPDMGHGTAPTQIQRILDDQGRAVLGAYQVSNIFFTMKGDWLVNVTLKSPDGKEETKAFKVHL